MAAVRNERVRSFLAGLQSADRAQAGSARMTRYGATVAARLLAKYTFHTR
jgi:hypothetical protein